MGSGSGIETGVGHDPRVVVNALIECAQSMQIPVRNVSLQKLLYFAHAAYLAHHRRPLIRGAFEAWEYGPVCRPIYDALKAYGRDEVTAPIKRRDPYTGVVSDLPPLEDDLAVRHLENVMRALGGLSPSQLISLSHVPGGAWSIVWNKAKTGATLGNRIDDELTKATFGKLKIALRSSQPQERFDEAAPFAGD
ncbi:type VI toxin-antitoxin system SocA family antitoxin [Sphingomonas molluscorum]|uniref:type VI toxin-antitoxin system SocA family antitoxin n=1 Tax=Sphingomonas TaxID=13687 RepID=UPI001046C799